MCKSMIMAVLLTACVGLQAENLDTTVYGRPSPTYAPKNSTIQTVPDYNSPSPQFDVQTNRGAPSQSSLYFQGQRDTVPQTFSGQYPNTNNQGINSDIRGHSVHYGQQPNMQEQTLQGTYNQGPNLQGTYNQNQFGQVPQSRL